MDGRSGGLASMLAALAIVLPFIELDLEPGTRAYCYAVLIVQMHSR